MTSQKIHSLSLEAKRYTHGCISPPFIKKSAQHSLLFPDLKNNNKDELHAMQLLVNNMKTNTKLVKNLTLNSLLLWKKIYNLEKK